MNEYENGDLIIDFYQIDTNEEENQANLDAASPTSRFLLDQETRELLQSTTKSVYNYLFNFESLNIDNEIFYYDRFIAYHSATGQNAFAAANADGFQYLQKFKAVNTRNLNNNFITTEPGELDSGALTREQMTIARHVHHLGDIKYGENEYSDIDNTSFDIYIPCMKAAGQQPRINNGGGAPDAKTVYCIPSDDETNGLRKKFGPLTGSVTAHIEEKLQELATEVFQTYITRENIPNIIPNNSRLLGIDDLTDEGGSAITVTATTTTTTTY